MTHTGHQPVLFEPVVRHLTDGLVGRYLDGTFGAGGHTRGLLDAHSENRVLALDCDPAAEERAKETAAIYGDRFQFKACNFDQIGEFEESGFAGILFDFGVSSFHFDEAERGFSLRFDAPLDMRMNPREGLSASEFLERASHDDLVQAIREFAEEPRWRKITEAIKNARGTGILSRTLTFAKLIEDAVGGRKPWEKVHPATRAFQGVRMAVNHELEVIERALPAAFERLQKGGRLAAISFHSLEDRLVKRTFKRLAGEPEHRRDNRPQDDRVKQANILTRKPITATEAELHENPRARSAKLRIIEKSGEPQ